MAKSDDVVTKKYLTLSRVKSENKLINEMRETEKRLENRIEGVENRLDGRIDSLSCDFRGFRKEMAEKYDNLMIMLDKIMGMLKKDDEERTAISYRVIDHEERIQSLEKAQVAL